jgi:long-subunit fatty acid transport protein
MATVVGRPDDGSAVFHNVGGLTMQPGLRIYVSSGLELLHADFQLHEWEHSDEFINEPVDAEGYYEPTSPTRSLGVTPMIVVSKDVLPDKLWVAASLFVSNGTGGKFAKSSVMRYHLIDGYVVAPVGTLSVAYQAAPWVGVGASIGMVNVRTKGRRLLFPYIDDTDFSGFLGARSEIKIDGSGWAPYWNLGSLFRLGSRVTAGLAITGRVDVTTEGTIDITTTDGGKLGGTQTTDVLLPWAFLGGVNVDVTPQLELAVDGRYYLYRQYDESVIDTEGVLFVDKLVSPKDYGDSWQLSTGGRIHDLAAVPALEGFLGLHYDKTPAPTSTVSIDQPTFTHWGIHLGARYELGGRYRLGASYIHYWYLLPEIKDSITSPPGNVKGDVTKDVFALSFEAIL